MAPSARKKVSASPSTRERIAKIYGAHGHLSLRSAGRSRCRPSRLSFPAAHENARRSPPAALFASAAPRDPRHYRRRRNSAARRGVRLLLERDGGVDVVGEATGGVEAVALIRREKPDLAFLDVQMPGGDGFAALAELEPATAPAIVFVTAYDEHALRAFEVNAVDYLLKPYDDARFSAALSRAKVNSPTPNRLGKLTPHAAPRLPAAEW